MVAFMRHFLSAKSFCVMYLNKPWVNPFIRGFRREIVHLEVIIHRFSSRFLANFFLQNDFQSVIMVRMALFQL